MAGLMYPKPRPAKLERADRKTARARLDKAESAKVKARSGGRCEVVEISRTHHGYATYFDPCQRRAVHVHHMMGGIGTRGRGKSALATHKQHVCEPCHRDITGDVGGRRLERVGGPVPLWTDHYRRVR